MEPFVISSKARNLAKYKSFFTLLSVARFLVVAFLLFGMTAGKVNAQQVSLSITPPLLELVIKPGKSIMVAYRVENFGDPVILSSRLTTFEPKDNLGNIRLKEDFAGPIRFSLDNADLELERPFFLKTGASQQLLLRIRAPEGAPEGDYYYTLLAETTPPNPKEGVGSTRSRVTIGSNILVTITNSGAIEVKPKVVLFKTSQKIYDSFDKIPLTFILANQGKNMIKSEGQINLKDIFGQSLKYDIVPKNILAQSERLVEATPSAQITCREQACLFPTSLTLSGFFIGLYNLSTAISFGENSPTVFASTSFFAFPFKLVGGVIFTTIIAITIIKRFSRDSDD